VVSGNVTRAVMLSFVDNELAALYRRIRHCRRVELERRGGRAPDSHRHRVVTLMDNTAIHKSHQMRDAIAAVGGTRVFVPPYSPDFNLPIEGAFSDTKRWLRRHRSAAAGHDDITAADVQQAWDTAGAVSVAAVLAAGSLPSRGLSCAGGVLSARRSSVSEFQLFSDRSTARPHCLCCAAALSSPLASRSLGQAQFA